MTRTISPGSKTVFGVAFSLPASTRSRIAFASASVRAHGTIAFVLRAPADEAHYARRLLHEMPRVVVELHVHQHVAGEELALAAALLTGAHLHHFFRRHHDLAEVVAQRRQLDTLLQRACHVLLESPNRRARRTNA